MTERERWIVYPLLFLALGASLRDKLVPATYESVRCQELIVVDPDQPNRFLAKIGGSKPASGSPSTGYVLVDGSISAVDADIDHELRVTGFVNAMNYAYRNVPIAPSFQTPAPDSDQRPRSESPTPEPDRGD
jgi:hypothetical protein